MSYRLASILALGALAVACTTTTISSSGAPTDAASTYANGVESLGASCTGACGSADDRKCSMPSQDCPSNLCLVDTTQPIEHLNYCTIDCTSTACPAGWRCEDIKAFGNEAVKRACVAEPMNCGDGVVQLGELCDGDSEAGHCIDCQKLEGVCGDGHVQAGEKCDGDTKDGYCDSCKKIVPPTLVLTRVDVNASLFFGGEIQYVTIDSTADITAKIPEAGDASGCGKLEVVEQSAELLRFNLSVCSPTAKIVWKVALPLAQDSRVGTLEKGWDAAKWQATAVLQHRASGQSRDFKGDWSATSGFQESANVYPVGGLSTPPAPAFVRTGTFSVMYGSAGSSLALLSFDFELTPPPGH